jgi:hypothetical protein
MIGFRLSSPLALCSHDRVDEQFLSLMKNHGVIFSIRHPLGQCRGRKARLRRRPSLDAKRADGTMEIISSVTLCIFFAQAAPESTFWEGAAYESSFFP